MLTVMLLIPVAVMSQPCQKCSQSNSEYVLRSAPEVLNNSLDIRKILNIGQTGRLKYHKESNTLYFLRVTGSLGIIDIENDTSYIIQSRDELGLFRTEGLEISTDGTVYISANADSGNYNKGIIKRGRQTNGSWIWETVAETEHYPLSNQFDHKFNAIALSPDGKYLYINSGSRTDHGELQEANGDFPDLREADITSLILRIPADTTNLLLLNDTGFLKENDFWYAGGVRNTYDLAFNGKGELFGAENSGGRDDPDELNWLRDGLHYGFPWEMGLNQNPMQFSDYNPEEDLLLNHESAAYKEGLFYNDPQFPSPPENLVFTDPVLSTGPDADHIRDGETGEIIDVSEQGFSIGSFTAHRSPLGLVFDTASAFGEEFTGDGFILGWTGANSPVLADMNDTGEDLLHLELTKTDSGYIMSATKIAKGFSGPVDTEIIDNKLYVVEYGPFGSDAALYEITFPATDTGIPEEPEMVDSFTLLQNYPNPFNPQTNISFSIPGSGFVNLTVTNILGELVSTLVNKQMTARHHTVQFDASSLSSGVYFYTLKFNGQHIQSRKMLLIK